jgi:hypothetical protein
MGAKPKGETRISLAPFGSGGNGDDWLVSVGQAVNLPYKQPGY